MIFSKFFALFFRTIGQNMIEPAAPSNEDSKETCRESSVVGASLKVSEKGPDEFFKSKNCNFKKRVKKVKKVKKVRKVDKGNTKTYEKKRKPSRLAGLMAPIWPSRKPEEHDQGRSNGTVHRPKKVKDGATEKLSSSSFSRQNSYWHDSLAKCDLTSLTKQQLDRQEASGL